MESENRNRIKYQLADSSWISSMDYRNVYMLYIMCMGENLICIIFHNRFNLTSQVGTVKIHRILFYRAVILATTITGIPRAVNDLES